MATTAVWIAVVLSSNLMGTVRGLTSQTCGSNPLLSTALKSRHAVSGLNLSPCSDVLHCLQWVGQAPGGVAGTSPHHSGVGG